MDDSGGDWDSAERVEAQEPSRRDRLRARLNRWAGTTEGSLLGLLRMSMLVLALLFLVGSALLLGGGLLVQLDDPSRVDIAQVAVSGSDLAPSSNLETEAREQAPENEQTRRDRVVPRAFQDQYHELFVSKFTPYFRRGEKGPGKQELLARLFDADTLDAVEGVQASRLAPVAEGPPSVLTSLRAAVAEAADLPATKKELLAYRDAKRARVCRPVTRTRSRTVSEWNSFSTNCDYWDTYPYGCLERRTVEEPYAAQACSMQYPTQLSDPANVLERLNDRYFGVLGSKLTNSERAASEQRQAIVDRKAGGWDAIGLSGRVFLGFMGVMLLYLLIALERHHRILARRSST